MVNKAHGRTLLFCCFRIAYLSGAETFLRLFAGGRCRTGNIETFSSRKMEARKFQTSFVDAPPWVIVVLGRFKMRFARMRPKLAPSRKAF